MMGIISYFVENIKRYKMCDKIYSHFFALYSLHGILCFFLLCADKNRMKMDLQIKILLQINKIIDVVTKKKNLFVFNSEADYRMC